MRSGNLGVSNDRSKARLGQAGEKECHRTGKARECCRSRQVGNWPIASLRCGAEFRCYRRIAEVEPSARENTPRSVFRQMITYATSRSVVSSALAFGTRRFSSKAMVAPMFSLRALRLRANTG